MDLENGANANTTPEGAGAPAPAAEPSAPVAPAASEGDWRTNLPPELRDDPSLKDVTDVATLAKRFIDTKSMVGRSVRLPTDDAGKETIEEFTTRVLQNEHLPLMRKPDPEDPTSLDQVYDALGRPKEPGEYETPEGADPYMFGTLANKAHELGLTKQQFEQLAQAQLQETNQLVQQVESKRTQELEQLRGEWGGAFEEKVHRSHNMVKALGGHEQLEAALENGTVDAGTLRFLDTVAKQLGGEGTQIAKQFDQVTKSTPDELRQRRDELTQRLLSESLTSKQREDLQSKILQFSEDIVAAAR